jgi:lysophospholipase L1-like esterase
MDAVFAADGVHPTSAGYAVMTNLVVPAIDRALAK